MVLDALPTPGETMPGRPGGLRLFVGNKPLADVRHPAGTSRAPHKKEPGGLTPARVPDLSAL